MQNSSESPMDVRANKGIKSAMATRVCVLDGGGLTDSENTLNSFLTKCGENVF